jgi:hypothetical protein
MAVQYQARGLSAPIGLALDTAGSVYFVDQSSVRKVTPGGIIATVAGGGSSRAEGVRQPRPAWVPRAAIALDNAGNLYVTDQGNRRVRRVTTDGMIRTITGNGTAGSTGDGGPALAATLTNPWGVAVAPNGDVFIADNGSLTSVTPGLRNISAADGTISSIATAFASSLHLGSNRLLYVTISSQVVTFTTSGTRQVVAGGSSDFSGDGGPATVATLNLPRDTAPTADGGYCVSDTGQLSSPARLPQRYHFNLSGKRKLWIDPGRCTRYGRATGSPSGLSIDPAGNLYNN